MERDEIRKHVWSKYLQKPVIDVGCGFNKMFDFDYVALDKAAVICSGTSGFRSVANFFSDFHKIDFPDEHFGFVNSVHSVEHAKNPTEAIAEWTRILKTGCFMYIEWPAWCKSSNDWMKDVASYPAWDEMLSRGDTQAFFNSGGKPENISRKPDGSVFLDIHFSNMSIVDLKSHLPKNLKIIEEWDAGDGYMVLQKVDNG